MMDVSEREEVIVHKVYLKLWKNIRTRTQKTYQFSDLKLNSICKNKFVIGKVKSTNSIVFH